MVAGLHRDEDGDAKPDLHLVDERHALLDHALGFQALDALPARGRGEAHPLADFGDRKRGVLLQGGEDFLVDGVHG